MIPAGASWRAAYKPRQRKICRIVIDFFNDPGATSAFPSIEKHLANG